MQSPADSFRPFVQVRHTQSSAPGRSGSAGGGAGCWRGEEELVNVAAVGAAGFGFAVVGLAAICSSSSLRSASAADESTFDAAFKIMLLLLPLVVAPLLEDDGAPKSFWLADRCFVPC